MACKVCNQEHGNIVCAATAALSRELREAGGEAEERLRAKCQWEQMTRSAVLHDYGDPSGWS